MKLFALFVTCLDFNNVAASTRGTHTTITTLTKTYSLSLHQLVCPATIPHEMLMSITVCWFDAGLAASWLAADTRACVGG